MDITYLSETAIKLKGKKASLVVDPAKTKTQADVIVLLDDVDNTSFPSVESHRLVIDGPGEYEVSGMKISAFTQGGAIAYAVRLDGINIYIAKSISAKVAKDAAGDYDIVLVRADELIDGSSVTALSPKVALLYSVGALESAKKMGKEEASAVAKYQATKEKLPDELEIVVLG